MLCKSQNKEGNDMTLQKSTFTKDKLILGIKENMNELSIAALIVLITCISPLLSSVFLAGDNLLNLLRQTAYTAIAAMGMYFVILIGGIDLSIGATIQVVGMVSIMMLTNGYSTVTTIVCVLLIGLVIGLVNGVLVTFGKLQPFVVTLVTKSIMDGIVLVTTDGASISGKVSESFVNIGTGYIGIFPVPVVITMIVFVITLILMSRTTYGRRLFVTGSNKVASYNSGTNVRLIQISAYILCALLATISGILTVARIGAFQPSTTHGGATGMELNAIAAAVIGGASLSGGKGSVVGALFGALLYGVLSNLFPLIGVNSYLQQLIQGVIIIVAVIAAGRSGSSSKLKLRKRNGGSHEYST